MINLLFVVRRAASEHPDNHAHVTVESFVSSESSLSLSAEGSVPEGVGKSGAGDQEDGSDHY